MLTIMCPNCRHRFPAPGCCNTKPRLEYVDPPANTMDSDTTAGGGCTINFDKPYPSLNTYAEQSNRRDDKCNITIHSGGCLIQTNDTEIVVQAPQIEIRPKLSGGGCLVQKRLPMDYDNPIMDRAEYVDRYQTRRLTPPPSGCQELPGIRRTASDQGQSGRTTCGYQCNCHGCRKNVETNYRRTRVTYERAPKPTCNSLCQVASTEDSFSRSKRECLAGDSDSTYRLGPNGDVQIHVNATFKLPSSSVSQCTLNITASATPKENEVVRSRNNFNGGGIIQEAPSCNSLIPNRRDEPPNTPISWVMPCQWSIDGCWMEKDIARLEEIKKVLHTAGWYYQGITWQQSEKMLKNSSIGKWLLRDSSDSRYTFAVSVRSIDGLTSVRVHFHRGKFRLDATPLLAHEMPLFDCPIKMLEYYVEYSKRTDRNRVWMNCHTQIYSQIYLSDPLVKEVRSLSHLARLAVNRTQKSTGNLPPLIRSYLAEYPYTL